MKIKFCGIRRTLDIEYMNEFLPDYIGFVFAESKRRVSPNEAQMLIEKLDKKIKTVGVFVNEDVASLIETALLLKLDVVQLHGDENSEYLSIVRERLPNCEIWKAVRVTDVESIQNAERLDVDMLLLDSFSKNEYGGTGEMADWELIKRAKLTKPYFLAGGLNAGNIKEALGVVSPFGLDISSGIETDGLKDYLKIKEIMMLLKELKYR